MLRDCLQASRKDAYIIKYAYVLDMMTNIAAFNVMLHYHLLELYTTIYSALRRQRDSQYSLDCLKVIRKYWLNKLHPNLYQTLRHQIYTQHRDDIDILPEAAIPKIKEYYLKELKMTLQILEQHLPQAAKLLLSSSSSPSDAVCEPSTQRVSSDADKL